MHFFALSAFDEKYFEECNKQQRRLFSNKTFLSKCYLGQGGQRCSFWTERLWIRFWLHLFLSRTCPFVSDYNRQSASRITLSPNIKRKNHLTNVFAHFSSRLQKFLQEVSTTETDLPVSRQPQLSRWPAPSQPVSALQVQEVPQEWNETWR